MVAVKRPPTKLERAAQVKGQRGLDARGCVTPSPRRLHDEASNPESTSTPRTLALARTPEQTKKKPAAGTAVVATGLPLALARLKKSVDDGTQLRLMPLAPEEGLRTVPKPRLPPLPEFGELEGEQELWTMCTGVVCHADDRAWLEGLRARWTVPEVYLKARKFNADTRRLYLSMCPPPGARSLR